MATPGSVPPLQPGQQPTQAQILAMQKQLAEDAAKNGMTVPQFIEFIKKKQMEAHAAQQQQAQQQQNQQQVQGQPQQQQGQPQPITPGPPNPAALAVAKFLKSQDLKLRTCILNGERKDMFKVKRALRALESDAYKKAQAKKNSLLPLITDRASLENTFKLLPMSLLALRVSKIDPHEGHDHAPPAKTKRTKGLWTVKIEQQQECREELHYVWLWAGPQWKTQLYALGALAVVFAIVMFPLWPVKMRLGVWYLSMAMLGVIGLFFVMCIFRLILFGVTFFLVPPGLWLYPNLFEDVGFFDSFRPVWGWQEEKKKKRKSKSSKSSGAGSLQVPGQPPAATATTTSAAPVMTSSSAQARNLSPRVEEVFDE